MIEPTATGAMTLVCRHGSRASSRRWRYTSVIAPVAVGSIVGFGMHGYELAVQAVARRLGTTS